MEDGFRGGTEIAGARYLPFNFEKISVVKVDVADGLKEAVHQKNNPHCENGKADLIFCAKQSLVDAQRDLPSVRGREDSAVTEMDPNYLLPIIKLCMGNPPCARCINLAARLHPCRLLKAGRGIMCKK